MQKEYFTIQEAVKTLADYFPGIDSICPGKELGYGSGCIFLGDCAEGGLIEGVGACNYYIKDPREEVYIMGVHKLLVRALDAMGFHAECYNSEIYLAYRN